MKKAANVVAEVWMGLPSRTGLSHLWRPYLAPDGSMRMASRCGLSAARANLEADDGGRRCRSCEDAFNLTAFSEKARR